MNIRTATQTYGRTYRHRYTATRTNCRTDRYTDKWTAMSETKSSITPRTNILLSHRLHVTQRNVTSHKALTTPLKCSYCCYYSTLMNLTSARMAQGGHGERQWNNEDMPGASWAGVGSKKKQQQQQQRTEAAPTARTHARHMPASQPARQ